MGFSSIRRRQCAIWAFWRIIFSFPKFVVSVLLSYPWFFVVCCTKLIFFLGKHKHSDFTWELVYKTLITIFANVLLLIRQKGLTLHCDMVSRPAISRTESKGNVVKVGNSSRCCKFQLLYHTWSTMIRLSLPLTFRCWEGAEPERVRRPALYLYRILQSAGVWTEIEKRLVVRLFYPFSGTLRCIVYCWIW